jgi:hypothetical protein
LKPIPLKSTKQPHRLYHLNSRPDPCRRTERITNLNHSAIIEADTDRLPNRRAIGIRLKHYDCPISEFRMPRNRSVQKPQRDYSEHTEDNNKCRAIARPPSFMGNGSRSCHDYAWYT